MLCLPACFDRSIFSSLSPLFPQTHTHIPPDQSTPVMGFPSSDPVMAFMASVLESMVGVVVSDAVLKPGRHRARRSAVAPAKRRVRVTRMLELDWDDGVVYGRV